MQFAGGQDGTVTVYGSGRRGHANFAESRVPCSVKLPPGVHPTIPVGHSHFEPSLGSFAQSNFVLLGAGLRVGCVRVDCLRGGCVCSRVGGTGFAPRANVLWMYVPLITNLHGTRTTAHTPSETQGLWLRCSVFYNKCERCTAVRFSFCSALR